jgi:hypothetical protein
MWSYLQCESTTKLAHQYRWIDTQQQSLHLEPDSISVGYLWRVHRQVSDFRRGCRHRHHNRYCRRYCVWRIHGCTKKQLQRALRVVRVHQEQCEVVRLIRLECLVCLQQRKRLSGSFGQSHLWFIRRWAGSDSHRHWFQPMGTCQQQGHRLWPTSAGRVSHLHFSHSTDP